MLKRKFAGVVTVVALAASAGQALADHEYARRPSVDIDKISGDLYEHGADWRLLMKFQVEIEGHRRSDAPLVLVVDVVDPAGTLIDAEEQPFQFVIKLDRPTDVDDDEIEFEGGAEMILPDPLVADPLALRLSARVLDERDGMILAAKTRSVDYDYPVYSPSHVRVGVAVGSVHTVAPVVRVRRHYAPAVRHVRIVRPVVRYHPVTHRTVTRIHRAPAGRVIHYRHR